MAAARVGGVVLAGGGGTRMGGPKQDIDWHGSTLASRSCRMLQRAVGGGPVAVVSAFGKEAPADIPESAIATADRIPDCGPLAGLSAGMTALQGRADAAVVIPCDLPLMHPRLIALLIEHSLDSGATVTGISSREGRARSIPGIWALDSLDAVDSALERGERRPWSLSQELGFHGLVEEALKSDPELALADPGLLSLSDVDTPADADELGSLAPRVRVSLAGRLSTTRAWTLGELSSQLDLPDSEGCVVNGRPIQFDRHFPLASRDAVAFPDSL